MKLASSLAVLLLAFTGCSAPLRSGEMGIEEALEASRESGRMVLVDVYAPWCGWCRRMEREAYRDPAIQNFLANRFIVTRLDGDDVDSRVMWRGKAMTPSNLARLLGSHSFPTTVFLEPGGKAVAFRVSGYLDRREFAKLLRYMDSGAYRAARNLKPAADARKPGT